MLFYIAMEAGSYEAAGRIIAYSVVHRGPLPRFFHTQFYDVTVCGSDIGEMHLENVTDAAVPLHYRQKLAEVSIIRFENRRDDQNVTSVLIADDLSVIVLSSKQTKYYRLLSSPFIYNSGTDMA